MKIKQEAGKHPSGRKPWDWTKKILFGLFVLYVLILMKVLLLRHPFFQSWTLVRNGVESWQRHLHQACNLVPFKSIGTYLFGHFPSRWLAFYNVVGNLVLMLPMGILLPCMCAKMRSFRSSMLTVLGIILAVEILQVVLGVGIFDVDDIILNLSGAMIGYLIWRCAPVQKILRVLGLISESDLKMSGKQELTEPKNDP